MSDDLLYYVFIPVSAAVASIWIIRKIREFQWGWVKDKYPLNDRIYIITGANTGLGFETTKALVCRGGTVIMACRSLERANEAISKIRQVTGEGTMIPLCLDLGSFDSIEKFADKIKDEYSNFNCLIENAGLAVNGDEKTTEGFEVHFGVNHLGHFFLTDLLKDVIKSNNSRIVVVSSRMHERAKIDFDNLGKYVAPKPGDRMNHMYNNSKLMNFYFARQLYKQGYDAHVLCPGLCHTDFFRHYNPKWYHYVLFSPIAWWYLRSGEQGAQNIIYAATDNINTTTKNPANGYIIKDMKQAKSRVTFSDEIGDRLWNESMKLCRLARTLKK
uniref:CSON012644 protein n=1 Tax=Culicoides sonorensis TaxID=179676 RepID=A0A336KK53_CULSO